jgi:hypothetical protein
LESERRSRAIYFRLVLAVLGCGLLAYIVESVGARAIYETLRPAVRWLPVLCAVEAVRIAFEALASRFAFGSLAPKIPTPTLYRAHVIGQSLGALAPAPRVINETIKIGLLSPFVGATAATAVGVVNQAATLIAGGLFSIPCGVAMYMLGGDTIWLFGAAGHAVWLVSSGLSLRAISRSDKIAKWLARKLPRFSDRILAFRNHGDEVGFFAAGPVIAMMCGRACQALQYGIAAHAVGIDVGFLGAMAAEGVNLIATAIGVFIPGGVGTTDGAFTLAAKLLSTTIVRASALALLMRCLQIVWLPIGSAAALIGAPKSR